MKATTSAKTTLETLTDEMANPRIASSALKAMQSLIDKSRRLEKRVLTLSVRIDKGRL
jgi:hypothetical protein